MTPYAPHFWVGFGLIGEPKSTPVRWAAVVAVVLVACGAPPDVDAGLIIDAGASDGGQADAGALDSGVLDSGLLDSGTLDSGVPGSGAADAGRDAGIPDAGSIIKRCTVVAHIGDSLSAQTLGPLGAAYADAGIAAQLNAYGGRAILQKLPDDPMTGKNAALEFRDAGFSGCWVIALGTNDTANIAAGATPGRAGAIDQMMTAIGPTNGRPVMWVNTFTTRTTGYWMNSNMVLWNTALTDAKARWPSLVVYDWAAIADGGSEPYVDGIHHSTAGYTVRNRAISRAAAALTLP